MSIKFQGGEKATGNPVRIFVDQLGYYPKGVKRAVVTYGGGEFLLRRADTEEICYRGNVTAGSGEKDPYSGDVCHYADFSDFETEGSYFLECGGIFSEKFGITETVYDKLLYDLLRAVTYNRCGCALPRDRFGRYSRGICHTRHNYDRLDRDNPGARPIDVTGGWHEAGDYSRNLFSGGCAAGLLMLAYEFFGGALDTSFDLPESAVRSRFCYGEGEWKPAGTGGVFPDVLSEVKWETDWALKLQFPDGGVSHSVWPWVHVDIQMPDRDEADYYRFLATNDATASFVGMMATAARLFAPYDAALAKKYSAAAKRAWEYLLAQDPEKEPADRHLPSNGYNLNFNGNWSAWSWRVWAAGAMFALTGDAVYEGFLKEYLEHCPATGFWKFGMSGAGVVAYLLSSDPGKRHPETERYVREKFLAECRGYAENYLLSGYDITLRSSFNWGSNMDVCRGAVSCIFADMLEKDERYTEAAQGDMHYLLGVNPLGFSHITGQGTNSFRYPHHRPCQADGIREPIPGYVSLGTANYESAKKRFSTIDNYLPADTPDMKSFVDHPYLFMMTEVEIDCNSYPVLMAAWMKDRLK